MRIMSPRAELFLLIAIFILTAGRGMHIFCSGKTKARDRVVVR